jgi:hypothetical protein
MMTFLPGRHCPGRKSTPFGHKNFNYRKAMSGFALRMSAGQKSVSVEFAKRTGGSILKQCLYHFISRSLEGHCFRFWASL